MPDPRFKKDTHCSLPRVLRLSHRVKKRSSCALALSLWGVHKAFLAKEQHHCTNDKPVNMMNNNSIYKGVVLLVLLIVVSAAQEQAPQEEQVLAASSSEQQRPEFPALNDRPGIVATFGNNNYQQQQQQQEIVELENDNDLSSSSFLRPRLLNDQQQDEDALNLWPFSPSNNPKPKDDSSCAGQSDCESCVAHSSWCHWCEKQNECHSKGSFYGCFSGVTTCSSRNKTVDPDDQHGCAAHATCADCNTASHFCHWCAHDNSCHVIGSVYGCATGVDCYSNDRCQRKTPQHLPPRQWFAWRPNVAQLHALPVAIVLGTAALIACCATVCFCICCGVKGAYDDLLPDDDDHAAAAEPLLAGNENDAENNAMAPQTETSLPEQEEEVAEAQSGATEESFVSAAEEGEATAENHPNPDDDDDDDQAAEDPLPNEEDNVFVEETDPLLTDPVRRRSIRPRRPRHMQRLYNACTACYAVTIFAMCTMVFCSIYFYPQMPVYNICNDDVAWKSIIDSMKSMHTEAYFEILGSLKNPNHISVALDQGTGYFHHNGKFAGTFTIPPFTAEAMSITDFLLVAHLSPGTWDAVQIAKEYAEGHLILHVNTTVVVRVPSLADFTYQGSMDNITVYVNEIVDRSLCACPTWDDSKNHSHKQQGAFWLDPSSQQGDNLSLELPFLPDN